MASSKETECPVCHEEYTNPKFLPCAHVTCGHCLLSWLHTDPHKSCPVCRMTLFSPCDLENADLDVIVDRLPDDYGTLAVLQGHRILQSPQVCDVCEDDDEARSFCFACSLKLCQRCTRVHAKFPGTKRHVTQPFSELTVQRLAVDCQVNCQEHSDRLVELYCPSHQKVMCAMCVTLHAGCGVEKAMVQEVAQTARKKLKAQAARLMDLGSAMNNKINHLEQELHQGKQDFVAASLTIKQQFSELQQALDKQRQNLLDHVRKEQDKFQASATSELAPLKDLSPLVMSHGQAADRLASNTPPANLLTMLAKLQPRLDELESECTEGKPCLTQTDPTDAGDANMKSSQDCTGADSLGSPQSGAEATSVKPSPTYSPRLKGDEVSKQQATSKVKCLAADLILDAETVDTVKEAIVSMDLKPEESSDESEATIAAVRLAGSSTEMVKERCIKGTYHDDLTTKTSVRLTRDDLTTNDDYAAAEDGTVSEDTTRRNTSTTHLTALHPLPPAADNIRERTGEDYVHFMSSSVPSQFRMPDDALPTPVGVKVTFDDIITVSSDQISSQGRLAAVSGFVSSFVSKHLDQTRTSDTSTSNQQASASEFHCVRVEVERQRLELCQEASWDNWRNDSLESVQLRRRSKSSSDVPSASLDRCAEQAKNKEAEGVALGNIGFAVLSSPTSHAWHLVDVGSRVMRGRDWTIFHGNVDGGAGRVGSVQRKGTGENHMFGKGWVLVHWNATGRWRWHRMGAEGCFDLILL